MDFASPVRRLAAFRPAAALPRSFSLALGGNLLYALCQWGTMVLLVKACPPEVVGHFGLGQALCAPVMMLCGMQLRTVLATDPRQDFSFRRYLLLRVLSATVGMAALVGLVLAADYRHGVTAVILAVGGAKAVELVGEIFYGLFQKFDRIDQMACSLIQKGVLSLAAFGATVIVTRDVLPATLVMAAAIGAVVLFYDIPCAWRLLQARADRGVSRRRTRLLHPGDLSSYAQLIWVGLPLGLVVALNSLNLNIPRYFLEFHCGERELGVFSALAALMRLGQYVETSLGQSSLSRLSRLFAEGAIASFLRILLRLVLAAAMVGGLGVACSLLFGEPLLTWLYNADYATHLETMHVLLLAAAIGYVAGILKVALDATRTFRLQLPLFVASALASAAAGAVLVPAYGLLGAALTLLMAKVVLVLGYSGMLWCVVGLRRRESSIQSAREIMTGRAA
jgi:O-antigen/teichoic acid export membrane protein